jgi:hypothetical protein
MLGPSSAAAQEYDGPTYDDAYLEIRAFVPIRERRSHKTQARLHFDKTGRAPDDVLQELAALERTAVARRSWEGWLKSALAVDGWAMPRHAVLIGDSDFGAPLTQIRPDEPVKLGGKEAKYVYTPGRTARRLGTNPLARELPTWDDPDALFVFVLEGTLKMCSVVEASYPAIDAGSVTLWHGGVEEGDSWSSRFVSEIERFAASHLVGRPVAVVCDSDWSTKDEVLWHTRKVTNVLNRAGARAVACAPPEPGLDAAGKPLKRGVDDWLGEHEPGDRHEAMLDLIYHERAGDAELNTDHPALDGIRADAARTVVALLRHLGETAQPDSRIAPYAELRLIEATGKAKRSLQIARRHAEERGLLEELTEAKRQRSANGFQMQAPLVRVAHDAMPLYRRGALREWLGRRS